MSCYGVFTPVEDNETSLDVTNADGLRFNVQFKYLEPISHHNQANHPLQNTGAACRWSQVLHSLSERGKIFNKNHVMSWSSYSSGRPQD